MTGVPYHITEECVMLLIRERVTSSVWSARVKQFQDEEGNSRDKCEDKIWLVGAAGCALWSSFLFRVYRGGRQSSWTVPPRPATPHPPTAAACEGGQSVRLQIARQVLVDTPPGTVHSSLFKMDHVHRKVCGCASFGYQWCMHFAFALCLGET